MTELNQGKGPVKGTELIVQAGGAVVMVPRRRLARRGRPLRPIGLRSLELSYLRDLLIRLRQQKTVIKEELAKDIEAATGQAEARLRFDEDRQVWVPEVGPPAAGRRYDTGTVEVERTFGRITARLFGERPEGDLNALVRRHGLSNNRRNRDNFRRQFKRVLGVDVLASEPWLEDEVASFTTENVSLIKSIEQESLSDVSELVMRRVRAGDSPSAIARQLEAAFATTETRAKLIARDQTHKFHSRLLRLRYQGAGVDKYIWRTVKDQRVRPDHEHLEGEEFSFDKPPVTVTTGKRAGERNNPGEDIQCRCFAEPLLEELAA